VAVGELEPGAGEGVRERVLVLLEAQRDLAVDRVLAQCDVAREHARLTGAGAVRLGDETGAAAVLRTPLLRAGGGLEELPLVREEDVEELVVPARRVV